MSSLSLCIVMVAILLWGSGLTIVANSYRRKKPLLLPKWVSPVTKRCKPGNVVKFTRCKDTTACQVQASAGKNCHECMSQVWDMFKPSKQSSPQNSTFCFGLRATNNEMGQAKSLHRFHRAILYFCYSLQYPLPSLVLTTPFSPTPLICSLFICPIFPPPLVICNTLPNQEKTVKLGDYIHSF